MLLGKNENYKLKQKIGHGSFGEVWLVKSTKRNKKYVLKKLKLHGCPEAEKRRAILESQLLSTLCHPNIIAYHDSFFGSSEKDKIQSDECILNIITGYCEGGDLYEHIHSRKGIHFEESQIMDWLIQICMALQYLHDKRILHRDLKTRNIFLTRSHLIKLGDFGIARILDGTLDMAATLIGTPYYMSPEILTGKPYNHKSDIWSLGCCVYEMASFRHAFKARDVNALTFKVLHGKAPTIPKHYSPELSNLTNLMLSVEPNERPSAHCLLEHSFIHKHMLRFLEITRHRTHSVDDQQKCKPPLATPNSIPEPNHMSEIQLSSAGVEAQPKPIDETNNFTGCEPSLPNTANGNSRDLDVTYKDKEEQNNCDITDNKAKKTSCQTLKSSVLKCDSLTQCSSRFVVISNISRDTNCEVPEFQERNSENVSKPCVSEARVRRRNFLQNCVSFESFEPNEERVPEENETDNCDLQRPNLSARQRRRNRLNEVPKPRPKSAPSRLKKNI